MLCLQESQVILFIVWRLYSSESYLACRGPIMATLTLIFSDMVGADVCGPEHCHRLSTDWILWILRILWCLLWCLLFWHSVSFPPVFGERTTSFNVNLVVSQTEIKYIDSWIHQKSRCIAVRRNFLSDWQSPGTRQRVFNRKEWGSTKQSLIRN